MVLLPAYIDKGVKKMRFSYHIEQKENQKIINEYKLLLLEYFSLKSQAECVYNNTEENNSQYDNWIFDKNEKTNGYFIEYKRNRKKDIIEKLYSRNLKEDKLIKLFKLKTKKMVRHKENISQDNLGIVLNLLGEFYGNVYRDLERSTNKKNDFIHVFDRDSSESNKYILRIEKIDESVRNKPLEYSFANGGDK